MKLYEVHEEYQSLIATTTPLLENSFSTLYSKIIYPAFIIGIILGVLSLIKLNGRSFNPFFGALILVLALYGFKNQLFGVNYGLSGDFRLLFVPISFITLLGPLAGLYIRSQISAFTWKKKYLIHGIPALLFSLAYLAILLSSDEVKRANMSTPFEPFFGHLEQLIAVILLLAYLYFAFRNVEFEIDSNSFKWKWIRRFQIAMNSLAVLWLMLIGLNLELYGLGVATVTYNPLWWMICIIIYWIIVEALLNPKFFFSHTSFSNGANGYSVEKMESDKSMLLRTMEHDHPYLDPSLSLDKLALQTDMNPKYLSLILNSTLNKNFYEFVNEYRIEKVKELLISPDLKHLTIAAIANEAGFNSKSSFNSIFKKYTNLTPKEYLKQKNLEEKAEEE
ncbi:MAG: helix-turn-helix domain-containing protein [Cyclobacteriaceae bacterium]